MCISLASSGLVMCTNYWLWNMNGSLWVNDGRPVLANHTCGQSTVFNEQYESNSTRQRYHYQSKVQIDQDQRMVSMDGSKSNRTQNAVSERSKSNRIREWYQEWSKSIKTREWLSMDGKISNRTQNVSERFKSNRIREWYQ